MSQNRQQNYFVMLLKDVPDVSSKTRLKAVILLEHGCRRCLRLISAHYCTTTSFARLCHFGWVAMSANHIYAFVTQTPVIKSSGNPLLSIIPQPPSISRLFLPSDISCSQSQEAGNELVTPPESPVTRHSVDQLYPDGSRVRLPPVKVKTKNFLIQSLPNFTRSPTELIQLSPVRFA